MRGVWISMWLMGAVSLLVGEEMSTAQKALRILDGYHAVGGVKGDRKLHVVCWRPKDRDFAKDYRERLDRILKHVQGFYGKEMERNGLVGRTLQLDLNPAGKVVIHEAVGAGGFDDYEKPDGGRIREECLPVLKAVGLEPERETIVIFTNLSNWDPVAKTFTHKSPYYAGGSHRQGTAWQLDSPELDTTNLALKEPMIRDGEYGRISLGKHNSIFIGGIAHELGHGLGLPHCRATDEEAEVWGTALMGSGNRTYGDELRGEGLGSFIPLSHALRLASHPQFSGSVKGMNALAKAEFTDLKVEALGDRFVMRGKVRALGGIPVYAVVGYLDPEGGGDYDSRTVVDVPDGEGRFRLECKALVKGKVAELRMVACLANGATSKWGAGYEVAKDGVVDVAAMELGLTLAPFRDAVAKRQMKLARELMVGMKAGSREGEVAGAVLSGMEKGRTGALLGEEDSVPLSALRPKEESVGWGAPAYDYLPGGRVLLESGGKIYARGIYAHAPAKHVFELEKGGMTRLTGRCGLPMQRGGSVVFVILVDGNEVWRSQLVKPGSGQAYRVDLTGVKELELRTEDGGDGRAQDWGVWLEPILSR